MKFKETVENTPNLVNSWKTGLQALRAEDRVHIKPENPRKLAGSVDIDTSLRELEPNANRWDFAIGYQHSNREDEVIYWVETHTGSDSQISVMLRKLEWLKNWMRGDGLELAKFEKDIVWVPSGATSFTKGSTQVKSLAMRGLRYSGSVLRIPEAHPQSPAGEQ